MFGSVTLALSVPKLNYQKGLPPGFGDLSSDLYTPLALVSGEAEREVWPGHYLLNEVCPETLEGETCTVPSSKGRKALGQSP